MKKQGFTTRSLNIPYAKTDPHNALQMPLYGAQAFEFESAEQIAANFRGEYIAHVYSRASNPTVEYFEIKMRELTGAYGALAVASGMAAITNVIFAIARSGDNIITGNQLFGHTYALMQQTLPELGIETRFSALNQREEIEAMIDAKTRAIFFETVTNPQLNIAHFAMLSDIARRYNILLIADSTLTPPNVFKAASHGVHIEVMSTTKYISGGATSFGGVILDHGIYDWNLNPNFAPYCQKFGKNALIAKLRKNIYRNTGGSMTAQTALFQIAGLDMLEIRVDRCYANCMALGEFLLNHPKVTRVDYPGLPQSPGYEQALEIFNGIPGTIMTFDLESEAACFAFMNRLKVIRRATNLNDNKSLIIHPWSTIYAEFSEIARQEAFIRPTMMRLSVGIENADDLIADIEAAL